MQVYVKENGMINNTVAARSSRSLLLTVFDGLEQPKTYSLDAFRKEYITFGRNESNDIVLRSRFASNEHGRFHYSNGKWIIEDKGYYTGISSTNGLLCNNCPITIRTLSDGDFIRIDNTENTNSQGILFVFSSQESDNKWSAVHLSENQAVTIGRDSGCSIVLPHITVSKYHAQIVCQQGKYYIVDQESTNGVIVNNRRVNKSQQLHEKDVISITNSKLIFSSSSIYYCCYKSGISVDADHVVITRGKGSKAFVTGNNISLNIKPGELVAIIGGSGAGKSTILNCMCGYLPPAKGEVYINGISLYRNFDSLKKLIGYVPQADIVYDNLTLYDMLSYTADLRLPKDISEKEREDAINKAIRLVELTEKKNSFIKNLSGGQKKRASIAVELLSDPNLLFLDEPTSGLDPGTERNLMQSLRMMANEGKTVIVVTHSTLQLRLCDKIIFMGKGGNLCYFGSYEEALHFFGISDIVDVFDMITNDAMTWRKKYDSAVPAPHKSTRSSDDETSVKNRQKFQLPVLCARYIKLVFNDRQRLILLLLQAPLLALLISLVADGQEFEQYDMTKSLLFALSCSAFWMGMLNAIQEVCKERSIMKREYMAGLSLNAYILSKILVLGILCLIQSIMIVGVFSIAVGLPEDGLFMLPFFELLITTFLTEISAAAMGLFVSSLFTNADRAMTVAPILLMPQILFSGLIFKLEGATKTISWFALCRWSMEGYGTTANLNDLPTKMQQQGLPVERTVETFYDFTTKHMFKSWGILLLYVIIFLALARVVLSMIGKEKS